MSELTVRNPASGEVIERLRQCDAAAVRDLVIRARHAQPEWALRPVSERLSVMQIFADSVASKLEELAFLLTEETGKTVQQSRNELNGALLRTRWFISEAANWLEDEWLVTEGPDRERISWDPLGVVANISAWNYPWLIGVNVFVPALIAGNAVLYKPSEFASLTGLAIRDLLCTAGLPEDVFVVAIGGRETGEAVVNAALDGYFFTGSYATGMAIHRALADRLVPVQLELGGKDPLYASSDLADVRASAAAAVEGAFYHNGQSCCAVERVYVHEAIWDEFRDAFVDGVRALKVGDPADPETDQGPLTRGEQIGLLSSQIAEAVAKGAKVVAGGGRIDRPGNWFEPTVLINVDHSMQVMKEESFGPLIGLMKVSSDEEAVRLMNDSRYGLTAAVYSDSFERAESILKQLDTGTAYWNCCDRLSPSLPWSGRRDSGIGSTLSYLGIRAFVRPRAWQLRG